ncbi:hypothetical protein EDD16DRAFT_1554789 [Pisolithus croceorrhizus]|nr:hypothetical protein EDD16DRAFT_1554789 [Pisolithus croceorrhizus]KAI6167429.1 hypothetical protein EDD17DRAFT_1540831 [Pisolithus thermaeus]
MPARCLSSGYSPLFTWALLHASPEATALPHLDEDASDYGITPQSGKRNGVGLQSFLYLDLAGSSASPTAAQTQRSGRQTHSRRKTSTLSRSTSWTFCTSELHSDLRREMLITFETPKRVTPVPPKRAAQVVSWRPSRESLRNIPSPKPAPLTSLPDPPAPSASGAMTVQPNKLRGPKSQPPSPSLRLSPLLIQKSTKTAPSSPSQPRPVQLKRLESPPYLSLTPSTSSSLNVLVSTPRSSRHRASQSVPSAEHDSSLLSPTFSPRSPAFSGGRLDAYALYHQRRVSSPARSESIASSTKMRSRVDALACLEGKGRSEPRRHVHGEGRRKSNFMSMSDGEDGEGEDESRPQDTVVARPKGEEMRLAPTICVEDAGLMADVEDEGDEEDQCVPNPSHLFAGNQARSRLNDSRRTRKRLSLSPARSAPIFLSGSTLASASASSSSLPATSPLTPAASSPMSNIAAPPATTTSASHRRKRRSTAESWFPLRSFIDLKTESDERVSSWKWRSFIEVGVA